MSDIKDHSMPDQKIIDIIREYINELSSKGINISKAYLYGSQAAALLPTKAILILRLSLPYLTAILINMLLLFGFPL